jgi:hypothetical protein
MKRWMLPPVRHCDAGALPTERRALRQRDRPVTVPLEGRPASTDKLDASIPSPSPSLPFLIGACFVLAWYFLLVVALVVLPVVLRLLAGDGPQDDEPPDNSSLGCAL